MTINPCKLHPDAKGDDAPKRELDDEGDHYTECPLCNRAVFGNRRNWNAANPLPEVKNG